MEQTSKYYKKKKINGDVVLNSKYLKTKIKLHNNRVTTNLNNVEMIIIIGISCLKKDLSTFFYLQY